VVTIVAIIAGAILGGVWADDAYGAVSGALLGWLIVRSFQQQRQIAALQQALAKAPPVLVPAAGIDGAGAVAALAPAGAAVPVDEPALPPGEPAPLNAEQPSLGTPSGVVTTEPGPIPVPEPAPTPRPARPNAIVTAIRGWLFGGNTIVKAGIGILFIGLAFLAKYAGEHVSVPIALRLAAIGGVALVLLAVGWRLRLKRAGYAQVLQGGAVAVLYLTLFVSFRFYGVLALGPVFALMVLVAALSAALAVLQDARALASIGALGGFAAPLLVSSGSGNYVALFAYYLVLDLGIAAVAWRKTWRELNLIGFFATFIVGTGWGVWSYRPEDYATSQAFLIAFFAVFVVIMLLPARVAPAATRNDRWINGSLLFGLPTVVFALQYGLVRDTPYGPALSALVFAAFYVLLATWARKRPALATAFEASLAIGTVFLTLAIPFALDARSTSGAWALEGAGLVWLGWRQGRRVARGFGYALLFLAGAAMLAGHERFGIPTQIFNAYLFNGLLAGIAALAGAYFVQARGGQRAEARGPAGAEAVAEPLLIGWGLVWLLFAADIEIDAFVAAPYQLAAWIVTLAGLALALTLIGKRLAWPRVHLPAIGLAPALAVGVATSAVVNASPLDGGGFWAWPIALAVHLVVLQRAAPQWPAVARIAAHALGALVLAGLGALEGAAITRGWGEPASAWGWLGWLVAPAAIALALLQPAVQRRWPMRAEPVAYTRYAAGVLTVSLLLWTVLANLISDGDARPLPHVPLVNPLDVGIAVALFAAWRWLHGADGRAVFRAMPGAAPGLVAAAAFVWLNAILIRAFHHYGGVPFRFDAWAGSLAVQTGIALLWTVTALVTMWLAARGALRVPWIAGAALLGAVVLKLLVVDLSGSGTVTRIVSFIGVGVLMLVIGYVAPWPGRPKEDGHAPT
jgi:uncharacterized membrane protein